jgi:dTDP-4-dehydrorhamnose 3,5-epimerase
MEPTRSTTQQGIETRASADEFAEGVIADVIVYDLKKFEDERGWLTELFRTDELPVEFHPEMAYISFTKTGFQRGPHEHVDQADLFCFLGPSTFDLRLWDTREGSPSYGKMMRLIVGTSNPQAVVVPKGVIHGYKNIGDIDGMVINCPNRLYGGIGRREEVDEIRHENQGDTVYSMA